MRASLALLLLALAAVAGCSRRTPADYTETEALDYLSARGFAATPEELVRAVREGYLGVVIACLGAGVDPDSLEGRALGIATATGQIEMLRVLLAAGADPNLAGGSFGQTPLVTAVMRDQLQSAELLLEDGADPDARTRGGAAALHFAKDQETARLLLEAGADADAADARGATPLLGAVMIGDLGLVDLLLQHGADPDAADREGRTAILYTFVMRFSEIRDRLLVAGAAGVPRPQVGVAELERYTGRYGAENVAFYRILLDLGRLLLIETRSNGTLVATELVALTPTIFYRINDPGLILFAIRIEDGRVTGLSRTERTGWVTVPRLDS